MNVEKLVEAVAKKTAEAILSKQTPAATATALTEKIEEKKADPAAYRPFVLEKLREASPKSDLLMETIGAASGGGMQAWAKDVFRCCPYPASALWNPETSFTHSLGCAIQLLLHSRVGCFIKWHDDIHGKLSEMF